MKKSILVLGATLAVVSTLLMSCNNSAKNLEDAQENVTEAKNNVVEAQDELADAHAAYLADVENYRELTEARIKRNSAIMADLRSKAAYGKNQTKEAYNKSIDALEQKNNELQNQMSAYKADRIEDWESFKEEFNHDMEELDNGFKSLGTNDVK